MAGGIYSVAQITAYIKHLFEDDYALSRVAVKGEISNCKYHSSGHIYFTLKDEKSMLACVMFSSWARGLTFHLQEGMQVVIRGSIRVFERDGRYQLYAEKIEAEGEGALFRLFEERKKRLEEMGLFSPIYKKPIPHYCLKVGIVTASTGAAIQDIINISRRRNPYVQLILCPAKVQGENAAATIVRGIERLDTMGLDCLIVGRGGGSIEDLWAFNEEEVAMAIFQCNTPVISAVGHETDFTIADFVADLRAPTPSAAAELAVFPIRDLTDELEAHRDALKTGLRRIITAKKEEMQRQLLRLKVAHPRHRLGMQRELLARQEEKIRQLMRRNLEAKKSLLALAAGRFGSLSPLNRLKGGYAFMTDEAGNPVVSDSQTQVGGRLMAHMEKEILTLDIVQKKVRSAEQSVSRE